MCGFGRVMDEAKIPSRAQMATCPKCHHKFRFRVVDDLEPEPPKQPENPAAQPTVITHAGLMSAQRAAAAEAWKRLQGPQDAAKPDAAKSDGQQPPERQSAVPPTVPPQAGGASGDDAPRQDLRENGPAFTGQNETQDSPDRQGPLSTGSPVPFEDLPRYGFFPGLFATIRMILATPAAFFRTMPRSGGMVKPLVFHLLLSEFMALCQYMWGVAGIGMVSQYTGSSELMDLGVNMVGMTPVLLFVFYPLLFVLRLMIMTGVVHLLLRMLHAAGGGAEGTFRVICYAAASMACGVVPFFGPVFGGLWSVGITVIGLKHVHRTNVSSALFAVLVPILLMLAAVFGMLQGYMKAV
jgi:hypothetical protein